VQRRNRNGDTMTSDKLRKAAEILNLRVRDFAGRRDLIPAFIVDEWGLQSDLLHSIADAVDNGRMDTNVLLFAGDLADAVLGSSDA
jgi:hypothetical protein